MLVFCVSMCLCSKQDQEPVSTTNMEKGIADEQSTEMASSLENIDQELINAAAEGKIDVVKKLIDAGADLTARDDSDRTALIWAALRNYPDVVKTLLEAGADINASTEAGYSGLMAGASADCYNACQSWF
jgi:ankyrin repeat protein